jgi:hypothetical protein
MNTAYLNRSAVPSGDRYRVSDPALVKSQNRMPYSSRKLNKSHPNALLPHSCA